MIKNAFIELTYNSSGKKVLINKLQIVKIKTSESGNSTYISLTSAQNSVLTVSESYETVRELLFS